MDLNNERGDKVKRLRFEMVDLDGNETYKAKSTNCVAGTHGQDLRGVIKAKHIGDCCQG